ncbi:MAG: type I-G CRISPR-associated helicase/endonuclease Cas3g [Syntrophales bacterium]
MKRENSKFFSDSTVFMEVEQTMSFDELFQAATGKDPFPWQRCLYNKFAKGEFPDAANIPTGLGKTSVVAIWLIALALQPEKVPRRLVYVVNRRTVVDQTTAEVENLRKALAKDELKEVTDKLRNLCALPLPSRDPSPLAVSTLRGQFADNREWSADPARPAVIIGTVDMIGSGLLFSRYTVGFKLRPHHAAFLTQDALLIHDEAHLEPAFQKLLDSIVKEQACSNDPRKLRVIALSATTRVTGSNKPFGISDEDSMNDLVKKRLNAVKTLSLCVPDDGKKEQDKILELAQTHKDSGRAILIFVHSVESATKISSELSKKVEAENVLTLTGTMRGKERDELVMKPVFKRFLPNNEKPLSDEGAVWLVATSAGEVGINISADHLICDLSTYESMAQRFGRVNRFGERNDSTITVVHPQEFPHAQKIVDAEKAVAQGEKDADKKLQGIMKKETVGIALEKTLALLKQLDGNASPAALEGLASAERAAAFSPLPKLRDATEIQFDAWALTSIRKPIAARPPVAPYLHGEAEWEPPETHVAWREELDIIKGGLLAAYPPEDLLEDFPLKPHELLRDTSKRVAEKISALIEKLIQDEATDRHKIPTAWLLREDGTVKPFSLIESDKLSEAYKKKKEQSNDDKELIKRHKSDLESRLADAVLILPASLGGISAQGLLSEEFSGSGRDQHPIDVADIDGNRLRIRASSTDIPDEYTSDYRLIRAIDTRIGDEDDDAESPTRYWLWLEAKNSVNAEKRSAVQPETLETHTRAIAANVASIAEKVLPSPTGGQPDLRRCLIVAAELHDLGKNRRQWQLGIGNMAYDPTKPGTILAKSGGTMRPRNIADNYRHEFGSLMDAVNNPKFIQLSNDEKDIALHLVAAHHGRARPHFPSEEVFDHGSAPVASAAVATEVPGRFAHLQSRFGRWGLAWLESLLRSADYAASAGIVAADSAFPTYLHTSPSEKEDKLSLRQEDQKDITLRVDVANPGQFFACCGLFELASRIDQNLLAYFKQNDSSKQWRFVITSIGDRSGSLSTLQSLLDKIVRAEITAIEPDDAPKTALKIDTPFNLILDWWRYEGGPAGKLKTWAGQMGVCSIANDMRQALGQEVSNHISNSENILFVSTVATSGQPYYFDANYAVNAQAQDVGFSVDKLNKGGVRLKTVSFPAVELLCLVGLQRARPLLSNENKSKERLYDYRVWDKPLPVSLVPAVIAGVLPVGRQRLFRFGNPSRAKDYRAFMPAVLL